MSIHAALSHGRPHIAAVALALALPSSALALEQVPPEALSVKIFSDRYVAAERPFSDLAALEAWATPKRMRVLWLDSCGPASTAYLLAAVERFHKAYADGVQIRTFDSGEPACVVSVGQVSSSRDRPSDTPGLPYYSSDKSGRSLVP
jgi:hypothetical protein